jgi:UDP-N-acetylmuramate-alanine ligase
MDGGGLDATFEYIKQRTELQNENVVIVCMGAGTITHLATRLIKELI